MRWNITVRMRAVYLLILALGALLSVLIFAFGEDALIASRKLVHQDLPLLEDIALLKVEVMEQESVLYEYYATDDRARFVQDYAANERDCDAVYSRVVRGFGDSAELTRVQGFRIRLRGLADELDQTLRRSEIDNEHAQAVLAHLSSLVRALNAELDTLTQLIEARVLDSTQFVESRVHRIGRLVLLYTMGIFLVTVFVGYYINAYLRADAERRRLAVFPERNPNPVMRLSLTGDLIYANPAASELLRAMGSDPNDPKALLPPDLLSRLRLLRASGRRYEIWPYQIGERAFECGIHYIPDLAIFHAYVSDITERRRTEERLAFLAYHNPVTELPNRRMLQEVAERVLVPPDQGGAEAAVFLLNIDRFRVVIETFGHTLGDELLRAVAARLQTILQQCREGCGKPTLYHFEGDLFGLLVTAPPGSQAAIQIAEKIMQGMKDPLYAAGREFFVSFSMGIALFPHDGRDVITLLRNAESAMMRVKRHGGHGFQLYKPEMNAMAAQWLSLENYLRHALEHNELIVYYQPQVDVVSGRVTGVEALLRWQHPERGMLVPGEFLRFAEETGIIVDIGAWVLRTACVQQRRWREQGLVHGPVAVNMSARQFHKPGLPALVSAALKSSGLAPHDLELEITETVAMHDLEHTAVTLRELKRMGVQLAIDDFGTGFSSLNYLKRFPIDRLKVDRSFIHNLTTDDNDAAITRAIITLGHALKQKVVAEGVETPEQLARLRQYDCDEAQGYLYSPPVPPAELERLLRRPQRAVERQGA